MTAIATAGAALKDALKQVPAEDWGARKPDISIGRDADTGAESVIIGVINGDREWSAIGARSADESFTIDIYVMAIYEGQTDDEAFSRAWELWEVVEAVVHESVTAADGPLGRAAGVFSAEMATPRGIPTAEEHGRGYVIESGVRFRSRIRPGG